MFDEIASMKKCNLQVLSDLLVASHSCKHPVWFKLDTGASGNMLPYDVWQQFFPGRSNVDLDHTIDKSVSLQAYNKSEIHQPGTCSLIMSHNGVSHTCHFYVVPSLYCSILGLSDLLTLHLVTFNCATTTSWSSCNSVDALTCNAIKKTVVPKEPLILTGVLDHPMYKPLFEGVGKFKIKPVEIKIKEGVIPYSAPPLFEGVAKFKIKPVKIKIKEGVIPYRAPPQRVPVTLQDVFKNELDNIEYQGTITKLDKSVAPEWFNSFVIAHRQGDPKLHICLDPKPLNGAII